MPPNRFPESSAPVCQVADSAVVLVNKRDAETAAEAIRNAYAHQYGSPCDTRIISCSQGAHLVKA